MKYRYLLLALTVGTLNLVLANVYLPRFLRSFSDLVPDRFESKMPIPIPRLLFRNINLSRSEPKMPISMPRSFLPNIMLNISEPKIPIPMPESFLPNNNLNISVPKILIPILESFLPNVNLNISEPKIPMRVPEPLLPNINRYVILPSNPCRGRDVELVICVTGRRENAEIRNMIRETWGSYSKTGIGGKMVEIGVENTNKLGNKDKKNNTKDKNGTDREKRILSEYDVKSNVFNKTYKIVLLFFIGSAPSSDLLGQSQQMQIENESQTFDDIVQEDFEDTYRNLSLKSVSVLKWVSNYCPDTKYILKVDDDMYVNIPLLIHALHVRTELLQKQPSVTTSPNDSFSIMPDRKSAPTKTSVPPPDFIIGKYYHKHECIRNTTSEFKKWYTPPDVYNHTHYPDYLSGTAYAMTSNAARRLYKASVLLQRTFWIEDIYITGFCAIEAGVSVYRDDRFTLDNETSGCFFRRHISGHGMNATEMHQIHKDVTSPILKCPSQGQMFGKSEPD